MRALCLILALAVTAPALAADPPGYPYALAEVLADEGRLQEAQQAFERAVSEQPDDPYLRVEHARFLLRIGRVEDAVEQADWAARLAPANPEVLDVVADANLAIGTPAARDRALQALERLRGTSRPDPEAMLALSRLYLSVRRPREAVTVLEEVLAERPGHPAVRSALVRALVESGDLDRAIEELRGLVEEHPGAVRERLLLADLYNRRGEPGRAVELLERAPAAALQTVELRRGLALSHFFSGHPERALEVLDELQASGLAGPRDHFVRARILAALGRNREAAALLAPLASRRPLQIDEIELLVQVLRRSGEDRRATALLTDLARAVRREGDDATAARLDLLRAELLGERGESPEALELVRQLRREGVVEPPAPARLEVTLLAQMNRVDEALRLIEGGDTQLSELDSELMSIDLLHRGGRRREADRRLAALVADGDAEALLAAAQLRLAWGQPQRAVELARQARQGGGFSLQASYLLGSALFRAGSPQESEAVLRELVDQAPDFAPALNDLGYMWADSDRNLEQARELLERAVRLDPGNAAYVDSLGWVHFRLGHLERAAELLERAVGLRPDDAIILEHLGDIYVALGRNAAARRSYRRSLELEGENAAGVEEKLARLTTGP